MKEQIKKIMDGAIETAFCLCPSAINIEPYADQISALCEAECQARVEGIFKEIEENMDGLCVYTEDYGEMHCCIVNPEKIKPAKLIFDTKVWQALKKQEGVDGS